jgi:DNA-binding response OmpR family regulator
MSPNGPQALVADHEPEVGEMSRRYLARAGLSVRLVAAPGAALTALAAGAADLFVIDLFVIDLTMPGLDVSAVRRALLAAAVAATARSASAGPPAPGVPPASAPASPPAPGVPPASAPASLSAPASAEPAVRTSAGAAGLALGVPSALAPPALAPVVFLLDRHGIRPRGLSDGLECRRAFLARPFSPRALVEAATGLLRPPGLPPAGGACSRLTAEGGGGSAPDAPGGTSPVAILSALSAPAASSSPDAGAGAGGPVLDGGGRRVTVGGKAITLTRTEYALLAALARQPGQPLSRQSLLSALEAERGKRPTARAIDVYVTQLRAKLGTDVIQTVHGVGYALSWPGRDAPV